MEPPNALNPSHINIARLLAPIYSRDRSVLSKIRDVLRKYKFKNQSGMLQFWMYSACPDPKENGFNLMLMHRPVVSTDHPKGLASYRRKNLDKKYRFVGFETNVGNSWLPGRSAQIRIADQRTSHHVLSPHYQHSAEAEGMGQLVMPVFSYGQGGVQKFEGIIELVTTEPKDSYVEDFEQIQSFLEDLGLVSTYMGRIIKVEHNGNLVRFPLPYSARLNDLRNKVTMRFQDLEHNFRIGYKDTNGNLLPISSGEELRLCLAESCSQGAPFVKMYIFRDISSLRNKRKRM